MKTFILILLVFITTCSVAVLLHEQPVKRQVAIAVPSATPTFKPINAKHIASLINEYRTSHGIHSLAWNDDMCPFTQERANNLSKDYSHNGFYNAFNAQLAAENLGGAFTDELIVQSWINSPSHLKALSDPRFTDTCVAIGQDHYVAQHFARF